MVEAIVLAIALNLTDPGNSTTAVRFSDAPDADLGHVPSVFVTAPPMTTLRFYDLDNPSSTMTMGAGDDPVELPAYFFTEGRYAVIATTDASGCDAMTLDECRMLGDASMATFMIGPESVIEPITPSPDKPAEQPVDDAGTTEVPAPEPLLAPETSPTPAPEDSAADAPLGEEPVANSPIEAPAPVVDPVQQDELEVLPLAPAPEEPTVDIIVTDDGMVDVVAH